MSARSTTRTRRENRRHRQPRRPHRFGPGERSGDPSLGSAGGDLDHPDRLIFDLDPGPGVAFADLAAAARIVRDRLAAEELESFVKTTGGKGLHVVAPLVPAADWDAVKIFARGIAEAMAQDDPGRSRRP